MARAHSPWAVCLLLCALGLSQPACWVGQNGSATAEYARQVSIASLRVAQLEQALTEAEARVAQLEEYVRLQGENEVSQVENFDQVNQEIGRIRGEIETLRFDLDQLVAAQEQAWLANERRQLHDELRLNRIESVTGVTPPPPPTDEDLGLEPGTLDAATTALAAPEEEPAQELPEDLGGLLDLAVQRMMAGEHAEARSMLEQAIQEHPGEEGLAEARYRLAETFFNERRWGTAARSFQFVVSNHGDSDWAAWSMLRQGECFEQMGQPENARLFYEDLMDKYGRSEAADEASDKLER